jgi:hypothetical protein
MRGGMTRALLALCAAALTASVAAAAPPTEQREVLVLVRLPVEHYRPGATYGSGYNDDVARSAQRRMAGRIAKAHGLTLVDDWPMPLLGLDCFVMSAPANETAEEAVASLSRDAGVAWSEPMHVYHAEGQAQAQPTAAGHNDPLFRAEPAAREWRLAELHQVATGRRVTVAVVDSQVEANHPDLAGQVAVSADFTRQPASGGEAHGTAVAGVIAAKADNGLGIAGIAPGARLMALRGCWQQPSGATLCDTLSLAKALHFAIERRAQVVNMSLAGPQDTLLGKLIDVAVARGESVVAAFDRRLPHGGFPASHPGVIAVADESLAKLQPGVYSAPGRDVPTTEPGGRWSLVNGDSFAAAHVSGLMALVRERATASGGRISLVATRSNGGPIDACATLIRDGRRCPPATSGETVASLRP